MPPEEPELSVESLAIDCLERLPTDRGIVDRVCAQHPELAGELRRILRNLENYGLLGAETQHAPDEAPEQFGDFRLLRKLGAGGMGVVHLAEQVSLDRQVAIKLIRPDQLHSAQALERFRRESLAASRLQHPGLCPVYEVGEVEGIPYIAMPYFQGKTLAQRIADQKSSMTPLGRAGIFEVTELVEQAARALHAAHDADLVHRDVKPGNLLVGDDGRLVILDFGLARDVSGDMKTLTASQDILGTPAYMAPEQITRGESVDRRTDVYALGVTLFECLTLELPFEAADPEQLYRSIRQGATTRARTLNPSIPHDLQTVIEAAMDPDRGRRYPTALEFAEDLRRFRAYEPVRASRASTALRTWRWTQRHPAMATFLVLITLSLGVSLFLLDEVVAEQRYTERVLRRTRALGLVSESEIAAQKDHLLSLLLALEADRTEELPETLAQLNRAVRASRERWRSPELGVHVRRVGFSGDGQRMFAATAKGRVLVWNVSDRTLIAETELPCRDLHAARMSSDGRMVLAGGKPKGAWLWRPDSDETVELVGDRSSVNAVAFGPEESTLVTCTSGGGIFTWQLDGAQAGHFPFAANADGDPAKVLGIWGVRILSDGTLLSWARDGTAGRFDPSGRQLAAFRPKRSPTARSTTNSSRPDGSRTANTADANLQAGVVMTLSAGRCYLWSLEGEQRTVLPRNATCAALSPNGRLVATATGTSTMIWNTSDGSLRRELARSEANVLSIRFFAGGERVLTTCANGDTYAHMPDGHLLLSVYGPRGALIDPVAVSPDGSLLLVGGQEQIARLFTLSLSLSPAVLYTGLGMGPMCEIDESHFAVTVANAAVLLWDPENITVRLLGRGGKIQTDLDCSLDGSRLMTSGKEPRFRVWNLETGKAWTSPEVGDAWVSAGRLFPDGKRCLIATGVSASLRREVQIWEIGGEEPMARLVGTPGMERIIHADLSPTGDHVVLGTAGAKARVWRLVEGATIRHEELCVIPHPRPVERICFDETGSFFLTACADGVARLHDLTGKEHQSFVGHDQGLTSVRFSHDQTRVITASLDGTARVWNRESGEQLLSVRVGKKSTVWDALMTRDERYLLTSSYDGRARAWLLERDELRKLAEARCTRELTEAERLRFGSLLELEAGK